MSYMSVVIVQLKLLKMMLNWNSHHPLQAQPMGRKSGDFQSNVWRPSNCPSHRLIFQSSKVFGLCCVFSHFKWKSLLLQKNMFLPFIYGHLYQTIHPPDPLPPLLPIVLPPPHSHMGWSISWTNSYMPQICPFLSNPMMGHKVSHMRTHFGTNHQFFLDWWLIFIDLHWWL